MARRAMHPRDRRAVSPRSARVAMHMHAHVPRATTLPAHAFPPTMRTTAGATPHDTPRTSLHAP
ncbi:hypothetical protein WI25_35840 [Burkholderia cepacia]|nr:hypothetical protein WI25_35840 [Burkholderia cepacia]KWA08980.1 hypothetical protein WL26_20110 [Burkholderia cepacia]KWB21685.1 hypothetical protein WL32_16215 [Burkholderia cepacia]